MRTFVVVGANLAGGRAAETLRSEGFDGRIVLVGDEPERPYERPPLSKEVVRGESRPTRSSCGRRRLVRRAARSSCVSASARRRSIRAGRRRSPTARRLAFDACLLATGGRVRDARRRRRGSRRRPVPPNARRRAGVRRRARAQAARRRHRRRLHRSRGRGVRARCVGCEVTMIEVLDVPLAARARRRHRRVYAQIHRDHGVDLRLGEGVERFEGAGTRRSGHRDDRRRATPPTSSSSASASCRTSSSRRTPGSRATTASSSTSSAGRPLRTCSPPATSRSVPTSYSGGLIRPEHFQNAQNQGPAAAGSMLGKGEPFQEVPWFWSDQYDVNLQMLGYTTPDKERVVRGSFEERELHRVLPRGRPRGRGDRAQPRP